MGIDPVSATDGAVHSFNRYAYANNNPYRFTDPDGNSPVDVGFLGYDLYNLAKAVSKGEGVGHAAFDVGLSVIGVLSPVPGTGQALKAVKMVEHAAEGIKAAEKTAMAAERAVAGGERAVKEQSKHVPDATVVCRGGSCKAEAFASGKGVTSNPATGKLDGISVGLGDSVASASKNIPHRMVGVTTAGDIRAAGGKVVNDHGNHGVVSGLTAEKAAEVFSKVVKNPNK